MADPWAQFQDVPGVRVSSDPWAQFHDVPKGEQFGPTREEAFRGTAKEIRASIDALPESERPAALKEWAKTYVERDAKQRPGVVTVEDKVRQFARGTPVGSWLDELNAATNAAAYKLTGGGAGAPYDETLAYNRARDAYADDNSTKLATVPVPFVGDVDVTTGGLTKLAGGLASIRALPLRFGAATSASPAASLPVRMAGGTTFAGQTMAPAVGNAAIQGGVMGAIYGAGEGESIGDRALNAGVGAGLGTAIGAAAPPVARALGRVVTPAVQPRGMVGRLDRNAVSAVADDIQADRLIPRYQQEVQRLGPEAALADMGPNLRTTTGALARLPGNGQYTIKDMVGETAGAGRRGGAPTRITADVDAALGPAHNLVDTAEQMRAAANQAARPYYQQFERTVIPQTPAFQRLLDRATATGAVEQARRLMTIEGYQPGAQMTGRDWDYIRRGVSSLAETAQTSGDRQMFAAASGLASRINATLDMHLRRQARTQLRAAGQPVPNGVELSPYANARRLSGEGQQFESGVEQGQAAFQRGTHPDQMRSDLAAMQARGRTAERAGFDSGARGAIRDVMGNSGTQFGPTGDSAARRALGSDYARDKLEQVVGPNNAQRIIRRIDAESEFERTRQAAIGNSVTSQMMAAQKRFGGTSPDMPQPSATFWGNVERGTRWLVNKMSAGALDERSRAMAADAARILSAQGQLRDAYMRELTSFIRRRGISAQQRSNAERLIQALQEGARAPAVEAATGQRP
jgi:hypothetical protein